ncbi:3-phosphoshikimate 1-carboxyvinyltransferase [Virgibacillus sp. W0181]|uniref:3-phosphoshikimate 1-carboxyvinyltransferase n=1 Tax=Virgibacillus sp. W0181 TaxID=3391581 RepID=UPI003F44D4C5
MSERKLLPISQPISGTIKIPGDKSISHRAVMLGSLAVGTTKVANFLTGDDCLNTIKAFQALGVSIDREGTNVTITSRGATALEEPKQPLYFGNSGTTARLMIGLLSGLPFVSIIHGDPFLTIRPMDRVVIPLKKMGVSFVGREDGTMLPLAINGGSLKGITYPLPVKSAQVKSAILLAGLFAEGKTTVIEPALTRNHTENMLAAFGADIHTNKNEITITNKQGLQATDVFVPGDISSAAFFMAAAAVVPGSKLTLTNIGLNETRTGIIDVLHQMGASIVIDNEQIISGERIGDITLTETGLRGIIIEGNIIPRLIDEIPIIALLATQAEGTTIIRDAEELRVKETDRITAVVDVLSTLGADIQGTKDGMIIHGRTELSGGNISSYNDHRIAMMGVISSLIAKAAVVLDDVSSIAVSYPRFFEDLRQVINK